ncbi:hypothetical protein JTB14_002682 [Gonioctena quinquepunctata]|nr:hypothetical protein JTB14_002682 [Gonioctena quinquepunctata]
MVAILKCHSQQARIHVTSAVKEAIRLQIVARVQPEEILEDAEDITEVFTEAIEVKAQLKITIKVNQVYKQTRLMRLLLLHYAVPQDQTETLTSLFWIQDAHSIWNKGIALEYTLPYTPQENGTAERMNRSLLNKVRTKFAETNSPRELWGEAILCSAYELNRSPTEANGGETPAQRWYKKNDLSKLRVFGSQARAVILPRQSKLEKRAQPCIMVGYTGAGYRLWNYEKNEIISSRDVRFNERNTNYNEILKNTKDEDSRKIIHIQEDLTDRINEIVDIEENKLNENRQDDSESTSSDDFEECSPKINETNRGRKINPPKYLEEYEVYTAYCLISSSKSDPLTYEDADKEWKEAIEKELKKLNTWTEAELPEGETAIQTRWVFRTKEDGTKKARVVAKGFQVKEKNSFESVYSPVARLSTIRLLLSVALEKDYNIRQLDIPTAFLNGTLESEVFIYAPSGVKTKLPILKLNRAFYGLKESPKVWNDTFNDFATKNKFERSRHDCCLYYNKNVWILLYVDDIIVVGKESYIEETVILKRQLY